MTRMKIFYLFHQKEGELYPVVLTNEQWDIIHAVLMSITKGNIRVSSEKFCGIELKEEEVTP